MGEAEWVPMSPPPGAPQEPPATTNTTGLADASTPGGTHLKRDYLKFVLVATLGATFGFLTGTGLWSEILNDGWLFLLQAIIAGLGAIVLFDPGMELTKKNFGTKYTEPKDRNLFAVLAILSVTLLMSAFHHSLASSLAAELSNLARESAAPPVVHILSELVEALKTKGDFTFAVTLLGIVSVCVGAAALLITCSWVLGAKHSRRAAWLGAFGGIIGTGIVMAVGYGLVTYYSPINDPRVNQLFHSWFWEILAGVLVWLVGSGVLGGLAIDNPLPFFGRYSLFIRTLGALAIFALFYVVVLLVRAHRFSLEALAGLVAVQLVFQNLGWGFGMHFHGESLAGELDPSANLRHSPGGEKTSGLALVASDGQLTGAAAADPADGLTPAQRAQLMVLRPQGERLWASVALVLAVIVAALVFYNGWRRKDPEIVINIQQRFELDSGLHGRALDIHSDGRIVTISGVVDNEAEHEKAMREAASVRGVKQVVDRVQVLPPAPSTPAPASTTATTPGNPAGTGNAPAINATISIGGSTGSGNASTPDGQNAIPATKTTAATQTTKTAQSPKATGPQNGLTHFLTKTKNNLTGKSDTPKEGDTSKTGDTQNQKKKGLFGFLKKNKDDGSNKTNNNKTPATKTKKPQG
jgi:hypothetical protein